MMAEAGDDAARYTSVQEIRTVFYPGMIRLLDLDRDELTGCPPLPAAGQARDSNQELVP